MKIRSAVALALCTTALTLFAAAPVDGDLTHDVAIHLGSTKLLPGDSITIDAIHGTDDAVTIGNTYRVDGHYTLASHDKALLAINVTAYTPKDGHNNARAEGLPKEIEIDKGRGEFHLYFSPRIHGDAQM